MLQLVQDGSATAKRYKWFPLLQIVLHTAVTGAGLDNSSSMCIVAGHDLFTGSLVVCVLLKSGEVKTHNHAQGCLMYPPWGRGGASGWIKRHAATDLRCCHRLTKRK